jgi:two-component system sensor histidine kinase TctE
MTRSIRRDLLKWLIAPLLFINIIAIGITYWLAWSPAQIAFDESLADTAWALIPHLHLRSGRAGIDLSQQAEQILRVDHTDAIYFVVRNADGKTIAGDSDFPQLRVSSQIDEPLTYDGSMRDEDVRVITLKAAVGEEFVSIGVAETLRKRTHIRAKILLTLFLLEGILTGMSIGIVLLAVAKGLSPLKKMQSDLNARSFDDLAPVDQADVPLELLPVAGAINGLLHKVQTGSAARQDFLANVAHQLRTPLSGLKTQLEWMQQRHAAEFETAHSTGLMMSSVVRMIRQTNQLLALARAEPAQFEKNRMDVVELDKLVEESVQYFVEEADKREIDLGFDLQPTSILGNRFLLRDMIDNLLDNAIRYSPGKGSVTVSTFSDDMHAILSVVDSGPGIPTSEREMIFNRFYRLNDNNPGSGLGLAIVRDIANDHGAQIVLTSGPGGKGTIFMIQCPKLQRAQ